MTANIPIRKNGHNKINIQAAKMRGQLAFAACEDCVMDYFFFFMLYPICVRAFGFSFFSSNSSKYLKTTSIFLS